MDKRDINKIPGANRLLSEALSAMKLARPKVKKISEDLGINQNNIEEKSADLVSKAKHSATELAPKVQEALESVKDYATEHEVELKKGAGESAKVASKMLTPPLLRPALEAFLNEVEDQEKTSDKAKTDPTPDK